MNIQFGNNNVAINSDNSFQPRVLVIGVGGAGSNIVDSMSIHELHGVEFVTVNTDAQALSLSKSSVKIQIGKATTKGLGSGSVPSVGKDAAEESIAEIKSVVEGVDMLFIVAGMGGGTGTGASPVIAQIAKELNILTVSMVAMPFEFEGVKRAEIASKGITELEKYSDAMVSVSNQKLFDITENSITFKEAFNIANDGLINGVKAIVSLMMMHGIINLDFNDIKSVLHDSGRAIIVNSQSSSNDSRVEDILNNLLKNNLFEGVNVLSDCKRALISISGDENVRLHEINAIASGITKYLAPDALVHLGAIVENKESSDLSVTLIATTANRDSNPYVEAPEPKRAQKEEPISKPKGLGERPRYAKDEVVEKTTEEEYQETEAELDSKDSVDSNSDSFLFDQIFASSSEGSIESEDYSLEDSEEQEQDLPVQENRRRPSPRPRRNRDENSKNIPKFFRNS